MDYQQSGVNIEEGYRAVGKYRDLAEGTLGALRRAVLNKIGGFAGLFSLKELIAGAGAMIDPVLVSGTDGVGTKLDIAFRLKKYDSVGIDCVAMCVNDILCHGARPLFFLDYLACGKLDADDAAALVGGVASGCRETGCVLMGGETAEMPGFYDAGKYDMAGFAVGLVDRGSIIDGGTIREGDALLGVASSGPHSNGFSLIRKVLPDLDEDFGGMPLGRALLEPTRIYVKPALGLLRELPGGIHGMAHITGGGFYENIPRMFAAGKEGGRRFDAIIRRMTFAPSRGETPSRTGAWTVPPVFARIASGVAETAASGKAAQEAGAKLLETESALRALMFNTFNMGIGLVLALDKAQVKPAVEYLDDRGFPAWEIGEVAGGSGVTRFV
ncbi:MAG: phosphoribosylformylglycinamidine cyclo-ligase [Treponema sp.]|jgi:phosphoribosylformylglycinamidine cyclo-ligase|nr:phosphoribosylformylglycinamidine cyclo-ligase [Treponema sp.]